MKQFLLKINNFIYNFPVVKYYITHPHILFINRFILFQLWFKKILNKDLNFNDKSFSPLPIDIILVTAQKDYEVLIYVVESIKKYIRHPIKNIVIISPKSNFIINLCKKLKCIFVDENTVLPITRRDIDYIVRGVDRSSWLFQQLLKWSADKYTKNKYFLVADADTIFCRPQAFTFNGKVILSVCSDLCYTPYFDAYKRLLGKEVKPTINLTSHHILYQKSKLKLLKRRIEKYSKTDWYKAIINCIKPNEGACISDYETYGQFVLSNYPDEYILEHWYNHSLSRAKLNNMSKNLKDYYKKYKTISFHSYKN